jgi:predicted Zn-dependent protease
VFEELRQSRSAEEAADAYARQVMVAAKIDPLGLKNFFGRMLKREPKPGTLGQLGEMLSTHPGTEQRMEKIAPLPDGTLPRPVISDADWQALKKYCG